MKTVKRTTIAILILTLLFSMAIPAMAAGGDYTITITKSMPDHVYGAYQIFEGNISGTNFVDVKWGAALKGKETEFLSKLKDEANFGTIFAGCTDAASVAKALGSDTAVTEEIVRKFADTAGALLTGVSPTAQSTYNTTNYTISVPAGYYLVKDDEGIDGHDSETMYILDVAESITVTPKNDIPTVKKKVLEDTDIHIAGADGNYNDVADWDIGETMSFRLYGTIPANFEELQYYEEYEFIFHDKFDDGISLVGTDGAVVDYDVSYIVNGVTTPLASNTFTATVNQNGDDLTFTCDDLKAVLNDDIYKNPTIVITYSAKLNEKAPIALAGSTNEVYLEFSNDVYGGGTGNTAKDKVIVFTYKLNATKVDGANHEETLGNAQFKLKKVIDETEKYAVVVGGVFQEWTTNRDAENTTLTSDANGKFVIQGLDADTYYLEETEAPEGYNKLSGDMKLEIEASYGSDAIFTDTWNMSDNVIDKVSLTINGGTPQDNTNLTVENNSGFTLPETGGFGTTLIYVIGGILVIGVSVILITRKRMSNQD